MKTILNKKLSTLTYGLILLLSHSRAHAELSKFFANAEIQSQKPAAFALQPESEVFVERLAAHDQPDKDQFLRLIRQDSELMAAIEKWPSLSMEQQVPFLRRVFALEAAAFQIVAPELIIDDHSAPNGAFFEFDLANPTAGKVMLNTAVLAKEKNPYTALALLIHETRHSAQFQEAFKIAKSPSSSSNEGPILRTVFADGYKAAFKAQKELKNLSFCDFLTLLNEYEAFQFGNAILGELTNYKLDMIDMGTFASQYDAIGVLKIDLSALFSKNTGSSILEQFNQLEQKQFDLLKQQ